TATTAPIENDEPEAQAEDNENISFIGSDLPEDEGFTGFNFSQFGERFSQDPIANSIAVIVLLGMIGLVVWIGIQFMQANTHKTWPDWILPVLLVIGLGIAIYLATVEVSGGEAICGPVGDCNAVQESEYSKVFGIPVAVLGMIGYIIIGASWIVARLKDGMTAFYAKMAMFLFSLFGLLFFIYLTFLEPFVIGATCAWCISSAIIFSLINLYTTPVALNAWAEIEVDMDDDDDDYDDEGNA
ncbi:MAG TPA: vitamin K epoxide reductase family protein, partial [Anaerolineales bacterium]|nr:vitamin K epoxide reductase family protein [Anaerolineales bacterium]